MSKKKPEGVVGHAIHLCRRLASLQREEERVADELGALVVRFDDEQMRAYAEALPTEQR